MHGFHGHAWKSLHRCNRYPWIPWISMESLDVNGIHGFQEYPWIPGIYLDSMELTLRDYGCAVAQSLFNILMPPCCAVRRKLEHCRSELGCIVRKTEINTQPSGMRKRATRKVLMSQGVWHITAILPEWEAACHPGESHWGGGRSWVQTRFG